jgi:membrane protease YdiL (CAAX protease family)/Tfp pilus assembly protein PilF
MKKQFILLFWFITLLFTPTWAQKDVSISFDHKVFIDQLNNSQDEIYNTVLTKYDSYLIQNPDDIHVKIEKCKFIQLAQYDEYDDYNPNQDYFDSCTQALLEEYPEHPEVLIYQSTILWGDEQQHIFELALKSISTHKETWSTSQLGQIYYDIAIQHYYNEEYNMAWVNLKKAIDHDKTYLLKLEYVRVLSALDKNEEALSILTNHVDTVSNIWYLNQRAQLFIDLKDYESALSTYDEIAILDTSHTNYEELANVMIGIEQWDMAREYLIKDTANTWNKESTTLRLFLFDLDHSSGDSAIVTYNLWRDFGYSSDPAVLYRFKLFFAHPFQSWKFRDLLGVITLIFILIFIIVLPSIWILPIHFVGHRLKLINSYKIQDTHWGLKSFWLVSIAYFMATFMALAITPGQFNAIFNLTFDASELETADQAKGILVFILSLAFFTLFIAAKSKFKQFNSPYMEYATLILKTVAYFIGFKLITGVYLKILVASCGMELEELYFIPQFFLSTSTEIMALVSTYGNLWSILIIAFLVPIYEEFVFRGVILDAISRYFTFNWANVLQSFLFAAVHMNLYLFPVFFGFGLITGMLRQKSGGLWGGIIFHVLNNLLAILVLISRGS